MKKKALESAELKQQRAQVVQACALLLLSPKETAQKLGVSHTEFLTMLDDRVYRDAWVAGRSSVREETLKALLKAVKEEGSVRAIEIALARANDDPTMKARRDTDGREPAEASDQIPEVPHARRRLSGGPQALLLHSIQSLLVENDQD